LIDKLIEVRAIEKGQGTSRSLGPLSFEVNTQDVMGIFGGRSSGKSTLIQLLSGRSHPDRGDVLICKLDSKNQTPLLKARLGVVGQINSLDHQFSVLDNLMLSASYFGVKKRLAQSLALELLRLVDLDDRRHCPIDELEAAAQRRLMWVRALIHQPELLVMDEPLIRHNPEQVKHFDNYLAYLKRHQKTVVLASSNSALIERVCQKMIGLSDGKIKFSGAPADLLKQNIGPRVLEYHCSSSEGSYYFTKARPNFDVRLTSNSLIVYLRENQTVNQAMELIPLGNVSLRPPNLADLFLKLQSKLPNLSAMGLEKRIKENENVATR
jgi:lipooligosaccharide transport system ATP-binding protein